MSENTVSVGVMDISGGEDDYQVTMADRLINVNTLEFPLNFRQAKFPFLVGYGSQMSLSFLQEYGYDLIHPTERPVGDVVEEVTPVKNGEGLWIQTWSARPFNAVELVVRLDNARQVADAERNVQRDLLLESGVTFDFGEEFGTLHIQMRDTDRLNILGLAHKALRDPTFNTMFCSAENTIVPVTAEQITAMSDRVLGAYSALMAVSWELRQIIETATTVEAVPSSEDMRALMLAAIE